ncbi:MAG: type III-A CRISPR-associated protein Csm2 [Clostridia bacterium]|nr:type III-A CRISPR-associated protein Csm2 [Clostridia bacterium]
MYNNSNRNNAFRDNRNGGFNRKNESRTEIELPDKLSKEDYVSQAEKVIGELYKDRRNQISTSKIRNFLSMASAILDDEMRSSLPELLEESKNRLQLMRIRLIYECGRDKTTRIFVEKTKMIDYLKQVATKQDFLLYAHYLEALVAYHRFLGGKE